MTANGIIFLRDITDTASLTVLYEVLIGSVLFFVTPKSLYSEFLKFIKPSAEIQNKSGAEESAVMRLKFASEALEEVSETVNIRCGPSFRQ